jgi:hypothetical protein
LEEKLQGGIGHAVLGVIQKQAGRFGGKLFAATRVVGEKLS